MKRIEEGWVFQGQLSLFSSILLMLATIVVATFNSEVLVDHLQAPKLRRFGVQAPEGGIRTAHRCGVNKSTSGEGRGWREGVLFGVGLVAASSLTFWAGFVDVPILINSH